MSQTVSGTSGGTNAAFGERHIHIFSPTSSYTQDTQTAADGTWSLSAVPDGSYVIQAYATGTQAASSGNNAVPYVFRPASFQVTVKGADVTLDFPTPVLQTTTIDNR